MSQHLQSHQISGYLLGDRNHADCAHLVLCPECRHEVEQFEQALGGLRGSIHRWSENELAAVSRSPMKPIGRPAINAALSMAVVLLLSVLGWKFSFQQLQQRPVQPVFTGSDIELMDDVRADMDRPVPRGMEPLQALP